MKKHVRRSSLSVGGYLSIIMSLLLAVQPAFGAFEGVKQKVASVKEAMARSRAVLKENWQCFRSGTGPNCTKEQRSALRIIQDFVTGKWAKAKAGLKQFYAERRQEVQVTGAVVAVLALLAAVTGGMVYSEAKAQESYEHFIRQVSPSKSDVDVKKVLPYFSSGSLFREGPQWERQSIIERMTREQNVALPIEKIEMISSKMDQLGWDTKFNGKTLMDRVIDDFRLSDAEKRIYTNHLEKKGATISLR